MAIGIQVGMERVAEYDIVFFYNLSAIHDWIIEIMP